MNCQEVAKIGAAVIVDQDTRLAENLLALLKSFCGDCNRLKDMAYRAKAFSQMQGAGSSEFIAQSVWE